MGVYANFHADEGTVSGTKTVTLPWRARYVLVINDSSIRSLQFKFNAAESFGTLKPTEQVSLYHHVSSVLLSSSGSITYRVWAYG